MFQIYGYLIDFFVFVVVVIGNCKIYNKFWWKIHRKIKKSDWMYAVAWANWLKDWPKCRLYAAAVYGVLATFAVYARWAQTENVHTSAQTRSYTCTPTPTQHTDWHRSRKQEWKSLCGAVLFHTRSAYTTIVVCLFVCLSHSLCMHAQAASYHSEQIVRTHTHTYSHNA